MDRGSPQFVGRICTSRSRGCWGGQDRASPAPAASEQHHEASLKKLYTVGISGKNDGTPQGASCIQRTGIYSGYTSKHF